MAFLELGGERLIYEALELASSIPLRYGEPLHEILGREQTMEYLQFVLRTASKGLLAGYSPASSSQTRSAPSCSGISGLRTKG